MDQCPSCGHPARPDDIFCEECGYKLQPEESRQEDKEIFGFKLPTGIGSWRTLRWIIAVTVLGLCIVGTLCGVTGTVLLRGEPEREVVRVTVEKIVTPTHTSTPTNTPGPSPTPTVTNTPTQTPTSTSTPTPIPTTIPGTVLQPGETWYEDDLALWMDVAALKPTELYIDLKLENAGSEEMFFEVEANMFRMVSNLGDTVGPPTDSWGRLFGSWQGGSRSLGPGEQLELATNSPFKKYNFANEDVTHVTIEVVGLSRIEKAVWQLEIPH